MNGLGSWLIEAREARGLTLEDAERDTRISRRYLQALEEEQFSIIPAPVYARGFLRSYSQYLGLDPQEAMARYPREEDAYAAPIAQPATPARQPARVQRQAPAPAENRPTWRRPTPTPTPIRAVNEGVVPAEKAPAPARKDDDWEPTIGIDIGVPVPTRHLERDPAAQTRTLAVVAVAIAAIVLVVLLAFMVSRAGGGDESGGIIPGGDSTLEGATDGETDGESDADDTRDAGVPSNTQPGIIPSVEGLTQDAAIAEIRAAGFEPNIRTAPSNEPALTVTDQSPGPGEERPVGTQMTIIVSEGPE